ncbi:MAG: T9SS type A sorting domain-containing protein, partial [Saprospiraceae bacterium]
MRTRLLGFLFLFLGFSLHAQYEIGETSITFTDASRSGRSIPTEIYYPADSPGNGVAISSGQFPIIVFGHGFSMSASNFTNASEALVPAGYIVMLVDTETGFTASHPNFAEDFVFVANEMQNPTTVPSAFAGAVSDRSAVMGHSMGGGASMLAIKDANSNFTTAVTFGAVEVDPASIQGGVIDSKDDIPTLTVAGQDDCVTTSSMSAGGPAELYPALDSEYKVLAEIAGASHCQFGTGFSLCSIGEFGCSSSIDEATQHEFMFKLALPWADYFLKDDCAAMEMLQAYLADSNGELSDVQMSGTLPPVVITAPIITEPTMDNLEATAGFDSYQWYLDGNPISGATTATFMPVSSGDYTVEGFDAKTCSALSGVFNLILSGNENLEGIKDFSIFPNPVSENLNVQFDLDGINALNIEILNVNGKLISSQEIQNSMSIPMRNWTNGIYLIRISNGNNSI